MSDQNTYWNEQHHRYSKEEWIDKPALFAQSVITFFPKNGSLLDAGCGQGQDSRYFAEHGYKVTAIDFSKDGLEIAEQKSLGLKAPITFKKADLASPLSFDDESFNVVYSHLAIHYFDKATTQKIFEQFRRVLKHGGILALLVNSVHDPEYGSGPKLEDDYFIIRNVQKRYFSTVTMAEFAKAFETILLDEKGDTYKDLAINTTNLIRFVGKKRQG